MKAQNKFAKLAFLVITGSLLLDLSTLALAESDAVRALYVSAANVPTNITGIHSYAAPPKGFNPVAASDQELATYGLPPRPDQQADPDHYAQWEQAMKAAKIRWRGELKALPGSEHAMSPAGSSPLPQAVQPQTGPQQTTTINASGVMVTNTQTSFSSKHSFSQIATLINVAVAQVAFGTTCSDYNTGYPTEISSAGFDGEINPENGYEFLSGVQGGVVAVGCYNYTAPYTQYWAYLGEWHNNLTVVDFGVNPGDVFYTYLEVLNSSQTYVLLEDLTLETYDVFTLSTPGIVGKAADWMVWRPGGCSGSGFAYYCPLPNTVHISFDGAATWTGGNKYYYPGSQAASTLVLNMLDDGFDQVTETVNQGSAGYEGLHSLMFSTVNCAYSGGCTP
ncbi:MAG: hypothetical protein WAU58_13095 [Terriglobales bacterium]